MIATIAAVVFGLSTGTYTDSDLKVFRDNGVSVVRNDASWSTVQPKPGSFVWTQMDERVAQLERHGLKWWPILDYSTEWSTSQPGNIFAAPRSDAEYAAYARAFAGRYRGRVAAYEIWNEPNFHVFWHQPNRGRYLRLFEAARIAIRQVDKTTPIIAAGLLDVPGYDEWTRSLERRGIPINLHPYMDYHVDFPYITEYGVGTGWTQRRRGQYIYDATRYLCNRAKVVITYGWNDPQWSLNTIKHRLFKAIRDCK